MSCEWIAMKDEQLPEGMRDATEWKWVSFRTKTVDKGMFAIDLRDARRGRPAIASLFFESEDGQVDWWACGVRSSKPCMYVILRAKDDRLTSVASGSVPTESCPACSPTDVEQTPPFTELWSDNHVEAKSLEPDAPFPVSYLSWNGGNSYVLPMMKFAHPWDSRDNAIWSGGGMLDEKAKRLADMPISKWDHPVLAWSVMLIRPGEELTLLDK
jgi:hypothetical protein